MRELKFFILGLALVVFVGCSGEDGTVGPIGPAGSEGTVFFVIDIDNRTNYGESYTDVEFAVELMDELPTVVVNGHTIEGGYIDEGIFECDIEIPLAQSVAFTVSSGGKSVSGTINVPTAVTAVTCNGVTISTENDNSIPDADNYLFEWVGGSADYMDCSAESYSSEIDDYFYNDANVTSGSWTPPLLDGEIRYFGIRASNGSLTAHGGTPFISSDWAKGFVTYQENSNYYYFNNYKNTEKRVITDPTARTRLESILKNR